MVKIAVMLFYSKIFFRKEVISVISKEKLPVKVRLNMCR